MRVRIGEGRGVAEIVGAGGRLVSLISLWAVLRLGTPMSFPQLGFPRVYAETAVRGRVTSVEGVS